MRGFRNINLLLLLIFMGSCSDNNGGVTVVAPQEADLSKPGSSTGSLVVEIDEEEADPDTIQGYVVGYEDQVTAEANSDGNLEFPSVPEGTQEVVVTAGTLSVGFQGTDSRLDRAVRLGGFEVIPGTIAKREAVGIPVAGGIKGRVTKSDTSDVLGLQVFIPGTRYQALTDEEGTFSMDQVPVGTHSVAVKADGYYPLVLPNIEISSGAVLDLGDLSLTVSTGAEGFIQINEGESVVSQRQATLNIIAEGDPVLMKISQTIDFLGVPWQAFASKLPYVFTNPGLNKIFVKFADANGLESSPYQTEVTVDLGQASLESAPSSYSNSTELTSSVVAEEATGYRFALLNGSSNCSNASLSELVAISEPLSLSLGTDGPKTLCLQAYDDYGPRQIEVTEILWEKDTSAPTPTLASSPPSATNTTPLQLSFSIDEASDFKSSLTSGSTCGAITGDWQTLAETVDVSLSVEGSYSYCFILRDQAGNESAMAQYTWTYDITNPTISVAGLPESVSSDTLLSVVPTINESGEYRYQLLSGDVACSSASTYSEWRDNNTTLTQGLGTDGDKTLCIEARDTAGNGLASTYRYQWEKNSLPIRAEADVPSGNTTNQTSLSLTVSGNRTDEYQYVFSQGSVNCLGQSYSSWVSNATSLDISLAVETSYTLCLLGRDVNGEEQVIPTQYTITRDTVPDNALLSSSPDSYNNESSFTLTVYNVAEYQYKLLQDQADCSSGSYTAFTSISDTISLTTNSDASYRLCLIGKDSAGNIQSSPTQYTWVRDTIDPDISLSNLPNALDNLSNLNVGVSGTGADFWQAFIVASSLDCTVASWSSSNSIASNITLSPGASGDKTLCVRTLDQAGNTSSTQSYSWTNEVDAPATTASFDDFYSDESTAGANTIFSGSSTDGSGSGVSSIMISMQWGVGAATCLNNSLSAFDATCPNFVTAAGTTSWSLTVADALFTNGANYTTLVKANDNAGNVESENTVTFYWDTTAPAAPQSLVFTSFDESIRIKWQPVAEASSYLIIYNSSQAVSQSPSDQVSYNAGDSLGSGDTVLGVISNQYYLHESLTNASTGYYAIYSVDALLRYSSSALTGSASASIPSFSGLLETTPIAPGFQYLLSWAPWTGTTDEANTISYELFTSGSSGNQDFMNPDLTIDPGVSSTAYTASNWSPLYMVLRGDAPSGTTDSNTNEVLTTSSQTVPLTNVPDYNQTPDLESNGGQIAVDPAGNILGRFTGSDYRIKVYCQETVKAPYCQNKETGKLYSIIGNGSQDAQTFSSGQDPTAATFYSSSTEELGIYVDDYFNVYFSRTRYVLVYCTNVAAASPCNGKTVDKVHTLVGNGSYSSSAPSDASNPLSIPFSNAHTIRVNSSGNLMYTTSFNATGQLFIVCYYTTGKFCDGETASRVYSYVGGGDASSKTVAVISGDTSRAAFDLDAAENVYLAGRALDSITVICEDTDYGYCQGRLARRAYDLGTDIEGVYGSGDIGKTRGIAINTFGNIFVMTHSSSYFSSTSLLFTVICLENRHDDTCSNRDTDEQYTLSQSEAQGRRNSQMQLDPYGNPIWSTVFNGNIKYYCLNTDTPDLYCDGKTVKDHVIISDQGASGSDDNKSSTLIDTSFSALAVDPNDNIYLDKGILCYDTDATGPCNGEDFTSYQIIINDGDGSDNAASWQMGTIGDIVVDSQGNPYYSDTSYYKVRVICHTVSSGGYCDDKTAGRMYTIMGTSVIGTPSDGTLGINASIGQVYSLSLDSMGNLYYTDNTNVAAYVYCQEISSGACNGLTEKAIYKIAGTGVATESTDNSLASTSSLDDPRGITVDSNENVFIAESSGTISVICRENSSLTCNGATVGNIYHFAGNGSVGTTTDNSDATATSIGDAQDLKLDAAGNLYILDHHNESVSVVCLANAGYCSGRTLGNIFRSTIFTSIDSAANLSFSNDDDAIVSHANLSSKEAVYLIKPW